MPVTPVSRLRSLMARNGKKRNTANLQKGKDKQRGMVKSENLRAIFINWQRGIASFNCNSKGKNSFIEFTEATKIGGKYNLADSTFQIIQLNLKGIFSILFHIAH